MVEWRKVVRLVNTGLTIGFLNDGRMRELQETVRGALFSHPQLFDERFDDLLPCMVEYREGDLDRLRLRPGSTLMGDRV